MLAKILEQEKKLIKRVTVLEEKVTKKGTEKKF